MKITTSTIEGVYIIEPNVFGDDRGYFMESYSKSLLTELGIDNDFVQDNESFSTQGVLRGLHYQCGECAQAKLVRVIQGEVLDVIVDVRPDSKTYGEHFGIRLSGENLTNLNYQNYLNRLRYFSNELGLNFQLQFQINF